MRVSERLTRVEEKSVDSFAQFFLYLFNSSSIVFVARLSIYFNALLTRLLVTQHHNKHRSQVHKLQISHHCTHVREQEERNDWN